MIVVIQCAASKRAEAGHFRTKEGKRILFVAHPNQAPATENTIYARPDDPSDQGPPWRALVLEYNKDKATNPFNLMPAFELYDNETYRRLVEKFGLEKTYILSAGWGLIQAAFLTPAYDITFSAAADSYKRRRRGDSYRDLCMLPTDSEEPVMFFGGKDYVPFFAALAARTRGAKTVYYNSSVAPDAPGCALRRFETTTRTNWHYECAKAFIRERE
jgi:hypothetical protein